MILDRDKNFGSDPSIGIDVQGCGWELVGVWVSIQRAYWMGIETGISLCGCLENVCACIKIGFWFFDTRSGWTLEEYLDAKPTSSTGSLLNTAMAHQSQHRDNKGMGSFPSLHSRLHLPISYWVSISNILSFLSLSRMLTLLFFPAFYFPGHGLYSFYYSP